MADPIAEVEAAHRHGKYDAALRLALGAWTRERAPELAEVIAALAEEAMETAETPKGRDKESFQAAWLALAKQPGSAPVLADTLMKQLPVEAKYHGILDGDYANQKYAAFFVRLRALEPHCPDPLIACALTRLLEAGDLSAWNERGSSLIYEPVLALLERCGDPSQVPALRELLANPRAPRLVTRAYLAAQLPALIAKLEAVEVRAGPEARAGWQRLGQRWSASRPVASGGQAMLEAIYREPDRDEPRLVYADWLSERGDPRGEFITLQLREDDKAQKRANALLREHQEQWLGALAPVITHVNFGRGFLDNFGLAQNAAANEEGWARAVAEPSLQTVTSIWKARGNAEHHAAFICSLHATNLRVAEIPVAKTLEQLAAGPERRIEELLFFKVPKAKQLKALAGSRALPRLSCLSLFPGAEEDREALEAETRKAGLTGLELRAREEWP
jgi:uncharacterized protein (TIGR02996 family)